MRSVCAFVGFLFLFCCNCHPAVADKRVALVIGNSAYQHVPKLSNPANDAAAVGTLFKNAGFDFVQTEGNLGINDMRRVVRDFSDVTRDADIAVIYYAGHGMEVGAINYLIPTDASLRRDIDVEDEALSLDRLLQVTESAKRLRLVILDACRDNPFMKSMRRTMASRSIGRGLARIEPTTSDTLVAFAVKAGFTADDGDGDHSPFTSALLNNLVTPGLDIRLAFGRVRDDVLRTTAKKQEPFVYGSLGGATVTLASLTTDDRPISPSVDPDATVSRDYTAATKIGTKEAWDLFLQKYPTGFYADVARAQRNKLAIAPTNIPLEKLDQPPKPTSLPTKLPPQQGKPATGSPANRCGLSAAKCEETKRVIRSAVASGRYTAADYRSASECGCGLPNQPKTSPCEGLRQDVRNWRSKGVPETHPGMISAVQALKQCGGE